MIDEQLLESAKQIRKRFINISSQLDLYQTDVRSLGSFLEEKIKVLDVFVNDKIKKIRTETEYQNVSKEILKEIEDIEAEEKKLHNKIKHINLELENLSKEEGILYSVIKERHPDLTDEQIVREVHKRI